MDCPQRHCSIASLLKTHKENALFGLGLGLGQANIDMYRVVCGSVDERQVGTCWHLPEKKNVGTCSNIYSLYIFLYFNTLKMSD